MRGGIASQSRRFCMHPVGWVPQSHAWPSGQHLGTLGTLCWRYSSVSRSPGTSRCCSLGSWHVTPGACRSRRRWKHSVGHQEYDHQRYPQGKIPQLEMICIHYGFVYYIIQSINIQYNTNIVSTHSQLSSINWYYFMGFDLFSRWMIVQIPKRF